jgi:glycosyltransferase involved in cell wall biosynthesis
MKADTNNKQLTVLSVNKFHYITGGADRCYLQWADLLERQGHETVFFSMHHERNLPTPYAKYFVDEVDFFNSSMRDLPSMAMRVLYSFQARKRIEALIQDTQPDVAHLHNVAHQLSPSILHPLKKHGIPVVQTLHDYKFGCPTYMFYTEGQVCERCKGGRYYNVLLHRCNRGSLAASALNCAEMYFHQLLGIYDNVDAFISPSNFLRQKMIEYGVAPERVVCIPNFIALDEYRPEYTHEDYFLFCGRLLAIKGVRTLLAAMASIKEAKLYVVGEGELKQELESHAADRGMENVSFLGYKSGEELKSIIAKSMFSVIPSEWYENLPYAVLESFALGTPVVAANIGGIPELIDEGVDGVLFKPGDVDDLVDKIRSLLARRQDLAEMGRQARAKIERQYDAETHYDRVLSLYQTLLERGSS